MRSREGLGYKTARQTSYHVSSADRGSSSKHNSSLDSAFYNTVGLLSIDRLPRPSASTTHSPPPSFQRPSLTRWSRVELWRPLLKQLRQSGYGLPHSHWARAGHHPGYTVHVPIPEPLHSTYVCMVVDCDTLLVVNIPFHIFNSFEGTNFTGH